MSLSRGARLGPYEILASLGAGGMGEVFKARDTRLDRVVAIKVMSAVIAATPEHQQRFEREARSLSALNHPHICTLHDVGEHEGHQYLVLEFVEGETLASRLSRGALPHDEVIRRGSEIASALDRAHRAGIVHRDLKPANIMLTKSGVKILDFGLARLKMPEVEADASVLTIANPNLTGQGAILGTLQYMSPEQLNGSETDARSDIFALGLVLYEMATGRRAFEAPSQASLIAAILERDPRPMRAGVSSSGSGSDPLERLVRRCLAKDPDDRWQSARDLMHELQALASPALAQPAAAAAAPVPAASRWLTPVGIAWTVAAALGVVAVIGWMNAFGGLRPSSSGSALELRLQVVTPATPAPNAIALSPDGRHLAFVSTRQEGAQAQLWIRDLDSVVSRPLAGTEGAQFPFWSADSRSLGFFAASKLHRYDLASGGVQELAQAPLGRGGAWNQDGVILFAPAVGALHRLTPGGSPEPLTKVNPPHETSHRFPQFLPDGRQFIYFAQGSSEVQGIFIASLDDPKGKRLVASEARAVLAAPDTLLYLRQGTVLAQRLDVESRSLVGEPVVVADRVLFEGAFNIAALTASSNGLIAYREGSANELVWFDRAGGAVGKLPQSDIAPQNCPELSPNGLHVALDRTVAGNRDIFTIELARNVARRFTFNNGIDATPMWSPDGTRVAFRSNRSGTNQIYMKAATGADDEERLPISDLNIGVSDWHRDNDTMLLQMLDATTSMDLVTYSLTSGKTTPVVRTPFEEREGQFSPDGNWVAFVSNESGRMEVWVQSYPDAGEKRQVSESGGSQPRWNRNGRELFFIAANGALMASQFAASPGKTAGSRAPHTSTPQMLFHTMMTTAQGGLIRQQYAVAPDGNRFLLNAVGEEAATAPVTVIANWRGLGR